MKSCINLVLPGAVSLSLPECFSKIRSRTLVILGVLRRGRACLMLVEQLESHLKELKTLENAGSVDEARITLSKLLAAQEHE